MTERSRLSVAHQVTITFAEARNHRQIWPPGRTLSGDRARHAEPGLSGLNTT